MAVSKSSEVKDDEMWKNYRENTLDQVTKFDPRNEYHVKSYLMEKEEEEDGGDYLDELDRKLYLGEDLDDDQRLQRGRKARSGSATHWRDVKPKSSSAAISHWHQREAKAPFRPTLLASAEGMGRGKRKSQRPEIQAARGREVAPPDRPQEAVQFSLECFKDIEQEEYERANTEQRGKITAFFSPIF